MIGRLDHVAIAVGRIADRIGLYRDLLDLPVVAEEEVPGEKVRVAILGTGEGGRIELVEATDPDSPIGKFLRERGEGIHHVCFRVESVAETCRRLEAAGMRRVGSIREGSEGSRIAFVHPRDAGGVLIELREAPAAGRPGGTGR